MVPLSFQQETPKFYVLEAGAITAQIPLLNYYLLQCNQFDDLQ